MLLAMVDKIYDKIDHQEKQDCQKKEQLLYQMILSLLEERFIIEDAVIEENEICLKHKKKEPGEILVFLVS